VNKLEPLWWILGSTTFVFLLGWLGVRMIRWAKRKSLATDLLGLGMSLPAAGINPQQLPQELIEQVTTDSQRRKDPGGADPNR
jgi:hypothetical protein